MRNSFWLGFFIFAIIAVLAILCIVNWTSISAWFGSLNKSVKETTATISALIHLC